MQRFIWTDQYSLGIHVIDEQHKHFFDIVNGLYDVLEKKPIDRGEVIKVVKELIDYGYYHLSTEEKYFNQFSYGDRSNHMTYHEAFRKKTTEYSAKIDNADTDVSALALEINDFAKDWLSHHILVADKQYVTFFKQNKID